MAWLNTSLNVWRSPLVSMKLVPLIIPVLVKSWYLGKSADYSYIRTLILIIMRHNLQFFYRVKTVQTYCFRTLFHHCYLHSHYYHHTRSPLRYTSHSSTDTDWVYRYLSQYENKERFDHFCPDHELVCYEINSIIACSKSLPSCKHKAP